MTDKNELPVITVPSTPANDQIASAIRSVMLVVGFVTAVAGFVSHRDAAGFIAYVQSSDFVLALGVLMTAGSFVWGQWKTRHRGKQLANLAADPAVPQVQPVGGK
jgi:hypothetical protein